MTRVDRPVGAGAAELPDVQRRMRGLARAAKLWSTRSAACVRSPAISKSTNAAWPSAETALAPVSGDVTCWM